MAWHGEIYPSVDFSSQTMAKRRPRHSFYRRSFFEPFDPKVSEYNDIVKKLDTFKQSLERFVGKDPQPVITSRILDYYNRKREKKRISVFKLQILQKISRAVNTECECQVLPTGSTLNGFGAQGSDLDLTIIPEARIWDVSCFILFLRNLLENFFR